MRTVLVFTDRSDFTRTWSTALGAAGLSVEVVAPSHAVDRIAAGAAALFDGGWTGYDEDEILAVAGYARAVGADVAVVAEGKTLGVEDVLMEICGGLVARGGQDAHRIAEALARRADGARGRRFEYLTIAPRGNAFLAILGDGRARLLQRPVCTEDDGGDAVAIELASDAEIARVSLASGTSFDLRAEDLGTSRNAASAEGSQSADLGSIDGVQLGKRIRSLRIQKGLTQAELARRTGIHRPNIARVEAGRHTPSLETLARIASAIGVPTTRVLYADG